jgi:NAD(P)-dependent dehydrogenase (short-subunit alcohol dehydrogenase family)
MDLQLTGKLALVSGSDALAGTGITVNSILPGPTRSRGVIKSVF